MIESYAISDRGGRADNQDRVLSDHGLGLFAVADGMGGHRGGSIAADLAISTLRLYIESSVHQPDASWPFGYSMDESFEANRLRTAIRLANSDIRRKAESSPESSGMGTTVAALMVHDETAVVGNVGDSRVYLFRGEMLRQLTQDDTMAQSPLGELMRDGASLGEMQHVLMQALGIQETVDVHLHEEDLKPGDVLLLTSDGLHGAMGDPAVRAILCRRSGVRRSAEDLLEAAMKRDASDNISVIVIGYDG